MDEGHCCTLSHDAIDEASSSSADRSHKYDSEEAQLLSELIWRFHMEERRERVHRTNEQEAKKTFIRSGDSHE